MQRYSGILLGLLLSTTAALPASADWGRVGSVGVSTLKPYGFEFGNFIGDRVALTARTSDVYCDSVTANFANGHKRRLFQGALREGQTVTVDLPSEDRAVTQMDFNCRPNNAQTARVEITAARERDLIVRDQAPEWNGFLYDYNEPPG